MTKSEFLSSIKALSDGINFRIDRDPSGGWILHALGEEIANSADLWERNFLTLIGSALYPLATDCVGMRHAANAGSVAQLSKILHAYGFQLAVLSSDSDYIAFWISKL